MNSYLLKINSGTAVEPKIHLVKRRRINMHDLGKQERIYKIKLQTLILGLIIGLIFIGMAALIPIGLWLDDSLVPENSSSLFIPFVAAASLFILFGGLFMIYGSFVMRNDRLCLYENGLVLIHKGQTYTACWDEIEGLGESAVQFVVNGLPSRVNYSFTVTKFDGESFTIHATLKGVEEIGQRLTGEVFGRRLPAIIEQFNRGETVRFGRFSINQTAVFSEKRGQLPLAEIKEMVVFQGNIQILKKNKILPWDSAKYAAIPNARILINIWENLRF